MMSDAVAVFLQQPSLNNFAAIDKADQTASLVAQAVAVDGRCLQYIAGKWMSNDIVRTALSQCGMALKYLPMKKRTEDRCLIAVQQDGGAIRYVPKNLITDKIVKIALSCNHPTVVNDIRPLNYVPKELWTKDNLYLAIKSYPYNISCLPKKMQTAELVKLAVSVDGLALWYIPDYKRSESVCDIAFRQNKKSIQFIPEKYTTAEMWNNVITELPVDKSLIYFRVPEQILQNEAYVKKLIECYTSDEGMAELLKKDNLFYFRIPTQLFQNDDNCQKLIEYFASNPNTCSWRTLVRLSEHFSEFVQWQMHQVEHKVFSDQISNDCDMVEKIKSLPMNSEEEAMRLYTSVCVYLQKKYGGVDRDYDCNPTRRGKEWLDIHHIKEYELDDIARRTQTLQEILRYQRKASPNEYNLISRTKEESRQKAAEIRANNPQAQIYSYVMSHTTLEELKPFNRKEQLLYANKVEHFLLHYLIDLIRGRWVLSGGPNYLWDDCVGLDFYGFDREYLNQLKEQKEHFYAAISPIELTLLYKRLIDWKEWKLSDCKRFWKNFNYAMSQLHDGLSYVDNKSNFFKAMEILNCPLTEEEKQKIEELPLKYRIIVDSDGIRKKVTSKYVLSEDEKTFYGYADYLKMLFSDSLTVPDGVQAVDPETFHIFSLVEKITIPCSITQLPKDIFTEKSSSYDGPVFRKLKTVVYKGTREMWDALFADVDLTGIELTCQKCKRVKVR